MENKFWKRDKGKVMFISGKKSLPLPLSVGWRDQRMWVLHRRSGGSIDRDHNMVLLTKKETDIQGMELEAIASQAIDRSLEVRVQGKPEELVPLAAIHHRLC